MSKYIPLKIKHVVIDEYGVTLFLEDGTTITINKNPGIGLEINEVDK